MFSVTTKKTLANKIKKHGTNYQSDGSFRWEEEMQYSVDEMLPQMFTKQAKTKQW